ncbi:MAG: Periplasmic pH-dependent serine endoprotease DegQ [Fimbriimonadaceae bacterium]|nr:Periplasmic pH-dependent serine endoprotease DegQ [Fimbriimonadaceae bacterium]
MNKFSLPLLVLAASFTAAITTVVATNWSKRPEPKVEAKGSRILDEPVRQVALETLPQGFDFRAAAKKVMPSVVSVDTSREGMTWEGDSVLQQMSEGSGVVISSSGFIVTNNHVIQGADVIQVHMSDGRSMRATLIGTDPRSDLAVLKVQAANLTPIEIGKSGTLEVGEWVLAVGNPLGYENTVSVGVVSSLDRTLPTNGQSLLVQAIQTDAAINQGNSGGALTNSKGQLVGINTAIASNSGGSVGIGFAIPIDRARRIVDDIIEHGRVRYGVMGIELFPRSGLLRNQRVRSELADLVQADPPQDGLLVRSSARGGPASSAGIGQYDILLKLDGKPVTEWIEFVRYMMDKRPGDKMKVEYWSRGKSKTTTVTLADSDSR